MSRRRVALLFTLPLVLVACGDRREPEAEYRLSVDVDLNPDVELASYGTFDVVDPREEVDEPAPYAFDEVEEQLREAIVTELRGKGLIHDAEDPDMLVNPLIQVRDVTGEVSLYEDAYGWYWGYQHLWTFRHELTAGSLVLDVVDPGAGEDPDDDLLIYRGIAWGLMAEDVSVIELELRNAVLAIFADWPDVSDD